MANQVTVLVVEDEPLIMLNIVLHLKDSGFNVLEARNADEAILLLEKHHDIRIMFTDVDMPGSMDGLRLAAAVRNRWPPVQIIVTSGHRNIPASELPSGSSFFAKPYSLGMISNVIRSMGSQPNRN